MPYSDPFFLAIVVFAGFMTLKMLNNLFGLIYIPSSQSKRLHSFYRLHSHYYNKLEHKHQNRFVSRAYSISRNLRIIGRQGFVINDKVVLTVVSAMVQLTFGYRYYNLPKFRTVFVYPDSYLNPFTGNIHEGEVNPRGLIILSWEKLVKGFADPKDKINLGLHEMAHALMHTIVSTKRHEVGLDQYLDNVLKLSSEEIRKINAGAFHIFRPYAGTSIDEFFAVAIEHFFEDPKELASRIPNLYHKLTLLLKQDPAKGIYVLKV